MSGDYPWGARYDSRAPYNQPDYEEKECPDCEGTGYTWDPFFIHDAIRCKRCDGKGTIYIES